jgi:recombination endonuclease VII
MIKNCKGCKIAITKKNCFTASAVKFGRCQYCTAIRQREDSKRHRAKVNAHGKKCINCNVVLGSVNCTSRTAHSRRSCDVCFRREIAIAHVKFDMAHPGYHVKRMRKMKTGWTDEAFNAAWKSQKGKCECCNVRMLPKGQGGVSVAADHDHKTGLPRGLICSRCNAMLGLYEKGGCLAKLDKYLLKYSRKPVVATYDCQFGLNFQ